MCGYDSRPFARFLAIRSIGNQCVTRGDDVGRVQPAGLCSAAGGDFFKACFEAGKKEKHRAPLGKKERERKGKREKEIGGRGRKRERGRKGKNSGAPSSNRGKKI
jgi:hypothetical protein